MSQGEDAVNGNTASNPASISSCALSPMFVSIVVMFAPVMSPVAVMSLKPVMSLFSSTTTA